MTYCTREKDEDLESCSGEVGFDDGNKTSVVALVYIQEYHVRGFERRDDGGRASCL